MSSIKDAIVRIGRSIRQVEEYLKQKQLHSSKKHIKSRKPAPPSSKSSPLHHSNLSNEDLLKYKPLITDNYRRKYYQQFLKPLGIPNLKTFEENRPAYNAQLAKENWVEQHKDAASASKNQSSTTATSSNFIENRFKFMKMMDLLVELTPESLKLDPGASSKYVERVIALQNSTNPLKAETTKYRFDELPKLETSGAKAFQRYIHQLTYQKWLYQNSSSLENGIIPDILLYTHSLEQEDIKRLRSVHTFNYLIHYFGYEKNQSSFARELLLVMNKDGHKPNIDTINELLLLCRTHSKIRSLTSTYSIVVKYLTLTKSLGLEINLTTWSRVYDVIDSVLLKEIFIDKMNSINLPIMRNMSLRILDDYMNTTRHLSEVVSFVEDDLKMKNWRHDSVLSSKILRYELNNAVSAFSSTGDATVADSVTRVLHAFFASGRVVDEYTFQTIQYFFAFVYKDESRNSIWFLVKIYTMLHTPQFKHIAPTPDTLVYMIQGVCKHQHNVDIDQAMFLIRGLVHEATTVLQLPTDTKKIIDGENIHEEGPPENFKIIRRMVGGPSLNTVEGRYLYENGFRWTKRDGCESQSATMTDSHILTTDKPTHPNHNPAIRLLRDKLSGDEILRWEQLKRDLKLPVWDTHRCDTEVALLGQLHNSKSPSREVIANSKKYVNVHKNRSVNATFRKRLERVHMGAAYVVEKMKQRDLI